MITYDPQINSNECNNQIKYINFELGCDEEDDTETYSFKNLTKNLNKNIEYLNFSHNGFVGMEICRNEKCDDHDYITNLFMCLFKDITRLRHISYCGYYSQFSKDHMMNAWINLGRDARLLTITEIT